MGTFYSTTRSGGFSLLEGATPETFNTSGELGTYRVTHSPGGWLVERLEPNIGGFGRIWACLWVHETREDVERYFRDLKHTKPRIRIRAGVGSGV